MDTLHGLAVGAVPAHGEAACPGLRPAGEEAPSLRRTDLVRVGFRRTSAPRDEQGEPVRQPCLLHEGGDESRWTVPVGGDGGSGSADGSGGRCAEPDRGPATDVPSRLIAPDGVRKVSAWAQLAAFDRGLLYGVEQDAFSAGLFVGGARLWQDFSRPTGLARSLLVDGKQGGLDGYLRWAGYDRDRRLSRQVSHRVHATALPGASVRGSDEGRARKRVRFDRGDCEQLPPLPVVHPGDAPQCVDE